MSFLETVADKRDGRENTRDQLAGLAQGAASGSIPDYQISAWLMAAFLNGLSPRETADLTMAMADSGERLDLSSLPRPWLDKHSTGGVGDKTTLVVLPILAACGVTMVKMSGRGLGITGGTIDKLESIPGFRTDLTPEEMIEQAKRIGIALSGQTPRLAPADGALYALRDVTGTVASIPLITASILSKKLAGGADTVVLDVKCGSGAFMKTLPEAEALARSLVDTGKLCGLKVSAMITDMNQPLGSAVGNNLEVIEAISVLAPKFAETLANQSSGEFDPTERFAHLCLTLAGHALEVLGKGDRQTAFDCVVSGAAFEKAKEWYRAQGATLVPGEDWDWPTSPVVESVAYDGEPGWVSHIDAETVGRVVVRLGGGRVSKGDSIDPTVGLTVLASIGSRLEPGMPVFVVHAKTSEATAVARQALARSVCVLKEPVTPKDPVLRIVH